MEEIEQHVIVKALWMNELGARRIQGEPSSVVGDDCSSLTPIESWLVRFRDGDLSCNDQDLR
jgi:hypothetical protein